MSDPSSQPIQPLTGPDFTRARNLWARAEEQRDDENAPYLDTIEALSYHVPDLLAEVDRLRSKLAELPDLDTVRRIEKERGSWGMQLSEARRERDDLAVRLSARTVIKETISELEDEREALALDAVNQLRYDDEGNQFEHIPGYCGPGCAGCWAESITRALGLDQDGRGQA